MRPGRSYRVARALLRPPVHALTRVVDHGGDNLPSEGGVLVAANHVSFIDPVLVAYFLDELGRQPRFLAKAELFDVPVIGRLLRGAGQIPVRRRTTSAVRAYEDAVAAIRRGECVVVYPEGTLTFDPDLWPMRGHSGVARIALTTHAPVIPLAHWGVQDILGPRTKRPHPLPRHKVAFLVGEPVDLTDLYATDLAAEAVDEATERIMAAITELLERLRGESAPETRVGPGTMGSQRRQVRRSARDDTAPDERQHPQMDTTPDGPTEERA